MTNSLEAIQMLNKPGSFGEECVVPESAASSYQLKATVAGLHRQPDHRTEGLRVMMSLFCLGPQGSDL